MGGRGRGLGQTWVVAVYGLGSPLDPTSSSESTVGARTLYALLHPLPADAMAIRSCSIAGSAPLASSDPPPLSCYAVARLPRHDHVMRHARYTLGELGPVGCPTGRLVHDAPTFTGDGGGGSGPVVLDADGAPLTAPDAASSKKKN